MPLVRVDLRKGKPAGYRKAILDSIYSAMTDPSLASEDLAQTVARLKPGRAIVTQLVSGLPAPRIVTYARDKSVGLIVMGSHGRTGLRRVLLGSVAAAVVRHGHGWLAHPGLGPNPIPHGEVLK